MADGKLQLLEQVSDVTDNGKSQEHGRGPQDIVQEWARMEARLTKRLEGSGDGMELSSEFGSGFRPFAQLYSIRAAATRCNSA